MAKRPGRAVLWLTLLAAPVALVVETGLRKLIFPAEFEMVRELLNPILTPVAWALGAIAAAAAFGGLLLQRRMTDRRLVKLPATAGSNERYQVVFAVFLLTASVPQVPALIATFTYMFGASIVPVLVGVGVCSVGVVSQALRVPSLAEKP